MPPRRAATTCSAAFLSHERLQGQAERAQYHVVAVMGGSRPPAWCAITFATLPRGDALCCGPEASQLILGLERGANAARGWADTQHERGLLFALAGIRPRPAALIVIGAGRFADAAALRALLHDRERVLFALTRVGPDVALRRVEVRAHCSLDSLALGQLRAHAARLRAVLVQEARVLVALTVGSPARAVRVQVDARAAANVARLRAVFDHEGWVLIACVGAGPRVALELLVLTLGGRADAARNGTVLQHVTGIVLALALLGPRNAAFLCLHALEGACATREWADGGEAFVGRALPGARPRCARVRLVIADA
mmetsp:Transcript_45801/g.120122  ORF Transcript_45801/g.120122 Transcript_45801/m.120122 type:complete len:312 (+) Transcript_45801:387-1322(+)|eukprot:CAMPEP_0115859886 /NCGR_PEP_ID=MMETSP0287-20121206/16845_1 /TAXON_ID=412157 /ORGANISM="Chrysochromulina rotalis, Strain UIO044" /LENGTH=311 /DNA_ID=CAMNT_0003314197 /DNA_START=369 /DNA_END=1304 /DNA_ORIENTATION=+